MKTNASSLGPFAVTGQDLVPVGGPRAVSVALDELSRRLGPDVAIGIKEVHVLFSVDSSTHETRIVLVDARGNVLRMIPPDSVSSMLASMRRYAEFG